MATTAARRDATPAERASRAAIGLRWVLCLQHHAEAADPQLEMAVKTIATSLALCVIDESEPSTECMDLWRCCSEHLVPATGADHQTLARLGEVREMLVDGRRHVGIASAATQGVWIRVGSMLASLWRRPFAANAQPTTREWRVLLSVTTGILRCSDARSLKHCADGLVTLANSILARAAGRKVSPSLQEFIDGLREAARQVGNRDDAYYGALGRQLTHVGEYDQLEFEGHRIAQLR
jgi:hypothetical protein